LRAVVAWSPIPGKVIAAGAVVGAAGALATVLQLVASAVGDPGTGGRPHDVRAPEPIATAAPAA
jgi:hypothetical protein